MLFLLNGLFGVNGLPYAQPASELVMAAAAVAVLAHLFRSLDAPRAALPDDL